MSRPCAIKDLEKAKRIYACFGFPEFSEQVLTDLAEWSGVAPDRLRTFFRYAYLNPAMATPSEKITDDTSQLSPAV